MKLLVLGGTSFAGRHIVGRALAEGHAVTTFNRGRTNPGLFPSVRSLYGDRTTGDYAALEGAGPFDAVVDVSAYFPRAVRQALAALGRGGINGPYILISSVSVYAPPPPDVEVDGDSGGGFTEEAPLAVLPARIDPEAEDVTGETYGPLKVLTEQAAQALLPGGVAAGAHGHDARRRRVEGDGRRPRAPSRRGRRRRPGRLGSPASRGAPPGRPVPGAGG